MYLMGWAPGMAGIGKRLQGRPEPVPAGVGQTDTAGLGMRPRPKTKAQRKDNPLVAVCLTGEVVYGKLEGQYLKVHVLNVKGRPEPTKRTLLTTGFEIRRVIKWGEGVARSCTPNEILTFRCTELILSHDKLLSMPQVAPILTNMYIIHNNTHLGT